MLQIATAAPMHGVALRRSLFIGLIAFLTLVDLFAAQAILPSLAQRYDAAPAAIGLAANAGTLGMAVAGLAVALIGRRIDRRRGIWLSLALLSLPTALLAVAPDLLSFSLLRIAQGLCMATAFSLTMAYLAERCSPAESAAALAAYITGAVASNLVGRFVAGALVGTLGLEANFHAFALLNLAGALLAWLGLKAAKPMEGPGTSAWTAWLHHLRNPALAAAFSIGFLILFAFIGTFTYANFVLAAPPIGLGAMRLGFVYFVFLPSLVTTPFAGRIALRCGTRRTLAASLALALIGLPLLLRDELVSFLAGMVLVGVGTFFAQAIATGFVGRSAERDRAAASGLYLASYYLGGLAGAAVVGLLFQMAGWTAAVAGIAVSLLLAIALSALLTSARRARPASARRPL